MRPCAARCREGGWIPDQVRDEESMKAASHPQAAIRRKKTLSYIIRLCQPSSQLFQFVSKSRRRPDSGCGQELAANCPPNTTNAVLH